MTLQSHSKKNSTVLVADLIYRPIQQVQLFVGLEGTDPENQMGGERERGTKHRNDTESTWILSYSPKLVVFIQKDQRGNNPYTEGQGEQW